MTQGLFFEEFHVGQKLETVGRTITETDVVNFAALSGDYNRIHTDAAFAAGTPFGQRIAHGMCVSAIASGLVVRTNIMEGTVLAFREINEWKFSKPVFFGDTIHVSAEVTDVKALPRVGGGAVTIKLDVINQKNDVCQSGRWTVLMVSRPKEA